MAATDHGDHYDNSESHPRVSVSSAIQGTAHATAENGKDCNSTENDHSRLFAHSLGSLFTVADFVCIWQVR